MSQRRVFVVRRFRRRVLGSWMALLALVALVPMAGCGGCAPHCGDVSSLRVLRTSAFPDNHIPPFDQTVTNYAMVQRLYNALHALPEYPMGYPSGTVNCPADFGIVYQLTFYGVYVFAQANIQAGGCQGVAFNRSSGWTRTTANRPQVWLLLAQTLGVPEIELFPTPQPTGPSAPTPGP